MTGVQTCALPISTPSAYPSSAYPSAQQRATWSSDATPPPPRKPALCTMPEEQANMMINKWADLVEEATGSPPSPDAFVEYLRDKVGRLYGVSA